MMSLPGLGGGGGRTFAHGVHPAENKSATAHLPIRRMPFVDEYVLPLSQHTGAPSKAVVQHGQSVTRGELLAAPAGFVSTALHAPVTGTVTAIEPRAHPSGKTMLSIILRSDPYASHRTTAGVPSDPASLSTDDRLRRIQDGGVVGMGGATFPAHVKFKVPDGKRIRVVLVNGCECEPYLTCDHRLMVERSSDVVRGSEIMKILSGAERVFIGVENNKPDAIDALRRTASPGVEIVPLQVKYPQGAEKMLIDALLGRRIPPGKLPIDVEVLVNNVGTAAAMADLFDRGLPLIERVVTITGPGVVRPGNLIVPIGTPIRKVLDFCGISPEAREVILGGPMMGSPQKSLDVPVLKGTSGILVLDRNSMSRRREFPCIRCGRCLDACPLFLNPTQLMHLVRAEKVDDLAPAGINLCFECGACAYSCPSSIPLVQWMRMGKAMVRRKKELS